MLLCGLSEKAWMLVSGLQAGCLCERMILECDQCGLLLFVLVVRLRGVDLRRPIITFNIFWPFASLAPPFPACTLLPAICPSVHKQWTSLGVIIVAKTAKVIHFQNGAH